MPFEEDEYVAISALEHLQFCPRQCALIHIERVWTENAMTAEGRLLHERAHKPAADNVDGVRTSRGLRLCSRELGLFGVADVVEFHRLPDEMPSPPAPLPEGEGRNTPSPPAPLPEGEGTNVASKGTVPFLSTHCAGTPQKSGQSPSGAMLPGVAGRWRPFPVEYKRGKRKAEQSYFVQLCAQALCLEEMLKTEVPAGALYHGKSRRRQPVAFDAALRGKTIALAGKLRELIAAGTAPPPEYGPKCKFCSLLPQCVPRLPRSRSAEAYVAKSVREILQE